jgi:hypothetical protein
MAFPKESAVFNMESGLMKVAVKDVNQIAKPELDKWENPIDVEIVYDNKEKGWSTANLRQLSVKSLAKKCKVVESKDGNLYTQWNGYRIDLVPLIMLYKKAGNEFDMRSFDINSLIGFEFDARVVEGKTKDDKEYIFIDWLGTLEGNGIETPSVNDPEVYDPEDLRGGSKPSLEDLNPREVKDVISDENLPF